MLAPLPCIPVLAEEKSKIGWGHRKVILPIVPVPSSSFEDYGYVEEEGYKQVPTRFGSQADWRGREFVGRSAVAAWNEDGRRVGEGLVEKMDGLVKEFEIKFRS